MKKYFPSVATVVAIAIAVLGIISFFENAESKRRQEIFEAAFEKATPGYYPMWPGASRALPEGKAFIKRSEWGGDGKPRYREITVRFGTKYGYGYVNFSSRTKNNRGFEYQGYEEGETFFGLPIADSAFSFLEEWVKPKTLLQGMEEGLGARLDSVVRKAKDFSEKQ